MFAVYQYGLSGTVREEVENVDQLIADLRDIAKRFHVEVYASKEAYYGGKAPLRVNSTLHSKGA